MAKVDATSKTANDVESRTEQWPRAASDATQSSNQRCLKAVLTTLCALVIVLIGCVAIYSYVMRNTTNNAKKIVVAEVTITLRDQHISGSVDISNREQPKWHLTRQMASGGYLHVVHAEGVRYSFTSPEGSHLTGIRQNCEVAQAPDMMMIEGQDELRNLLQGGRAEIDVIELAPVSAMKHEYEIADGIFAPCAIDGASKNTSTEVPPPLGLNASTPSYTYDDDEAAEGGELAPKRRALQSTGSSAGGCCQRSPSDDRCAPWEYLNGVCIVLQRRSIGCNRNVWMASKEYDPTSGRCLTPVDAPSEASNDILGLTQWDVLTGQHCSLLDRLPAASRYSDSWSQFGSLADAKASCLGLGADQCTGIVQYNQIPTWFMRCLPNSAMTSVAYLTTHRLVGVVRAPSAPGPTWRSSTCPVMAALVKNGDILPGDCIGDECSIPGGDTRGWVTKAQTVEAMLNVGISPSVVTQTTDGNFDPGTGRINLFGMNNVRDADGEGSHDVRLGGREHYRSTGIRDSSTPREEIYTLFSQQAGADRMFSLAEVEDAANLFDADPDDLSQFPRSNDVEPGAKPSGCVGSEPKGDPACSSTLKGSISFMHQEFGHPTGVGATMPESEMRALWLEGEYPSHFRARNPSSCSGGSFGCGTCWSLYRSSVGSDREVQKEKWCRCMRNKDFLDDSRNFESISSAYRNTCIDDRACSPFCFAPAQGSFYGATTTG